MPQMILQSHDLDPQGLVAQNLASIADIPEDQIDPDPDCVQENGETIYPALLNNTLLVAIKKLNALRAPGTAPPFKPSIDLMRIAQKQARLCALTDNNTSTDASGGTSTTRIQNAGAGFNTAQAEVVVGPGYATPGAVVGAGTPGTGIGFTTGNNATARQVNLLQVGVGYATNKNGDRYWVFDFGTP